MIKFFEKTRGIKNLKYFVMVGIIAVTISNYCYAVDDDIGFNNEEVLLEEAENKEGSVEYEEDSTEYEEDFELPVLYFKAINPGYTFDDKQNVGEMIEIARRDSDTPILLAGATVGYTNSSGNYSVLAEFPDNSWITGESILLRLASSPDSELAALNYTKTLAFKAGLTLLFDDEIIDEVCWSGKDGCYKAFDSARPTTLVRNSETGEFEHLTDYEPVFNAENYIEVVEDEGLNEPGDEPEDEEGGEEPNEDGGSSDQVGDDKDGNDGEDYGEELKDEEGTESEVVLGNCRNVRFSEILSYYVELVNEQFIELFNEGEDTILDGCFMRYKNKKYELKGEILAGDFYIYKPDGFRLTKNPVKSNVVELIDGDGEVVDILEYPNGQKKGTSFALITNEDEKEWAITYDLTPGFQNHYQQFRTCEAGKVINELTGNCVKETAEVIKICPEGYFLNEETGRCKKEVVEIEKICKDGYYLNEATGRCKKAIVEVEKICKEGYYLNEATGRCKKEVVETERVCKDGYYLNESTGRCRKVVTETVKTCDEGYYLNILTGRCNKIKEETEKICKEGYYLNEETGRCRKIRENDGAEYAIETKTYDEKSTFVALYAVLGVVVVALGYVIYQFRKEIGRFVKRIFHR